MTKKSVSLTIEGKPVNCPALVAIVGGRNAGSSNIQAWQELHASGVVQAFADHSVICVLKDEKPFRQMTKEALAKGLEMVDELITMRKQEVSLKNKLSALQVSFVNPTSPEFSADEIKNQLADVLQPKSGKISAK